MRSQMRRGGTVIRRTFTLLSLFTTAAGMTLLLPGGGRADMLSPLYQSAPLTTSGDLLGLVNVQIPAGADLFVNGLAENGRIIFSAAAPHGARPEMLLQWAGGALTPIVTPGIGPVSAWPLDEYWPHDVGVDQPVRVNENGSVVFSTNHKYGDSPYGTFRWDAKTQKVIPVRLKGEPATGNLVFTNTGGVSPAINNRDEIALVGQVRNPNGPSGYGLFFLGQDNVLRPVLLPGDLLPVAASGVVKAVTNEYFQPSINDHGRIAFLAQSRGTAGYSAYAWEYGSLEQIMISGARLPSGARITGVSSVSLNNRDRSALVAATTDRAHSNQYGLYRALNGKIMPIVEPGMSMPGGGTLQTAQYTYPFEGSPPIMAMSEANATGQYAFLAALTDGSTGAYRLDPDGTLTLLFKTNPRPAPVQVADITPAMTFVPGSRPCINNHGQVALSLRPDPSHSMIMLLTPIQP
jgi:hypothetical protein